MLRLRSCIFTRLLSTPTATHGCSIRRLLSTAPAALAISPNPGFAVEDYLVSTCGLTQAQALKASSKLSHLKSPSKPDAVLAFLAGLGLSPADVALVVAKEPKLLCAGVERILAPNVVALTGVGLSRSDIVRLISLGGFHFRSRSDLSKLRYYLTLFRSPETFFRALKRGGCYFLASDLERVVKPNVAVLLELGLGAGDLAMLCAAQPWLLTSTVERIRAMVACIEGLGVPRGSRMFRHAMNALAFVSEEKIAVGVDNLKKIFRWSDAEVSIAVSKGPFVLTKSEESLQRRAEFFFSEVGLEPAYIARRPVMLCYSLEGRLRPRYYLIKLLEKNGLRDHDRDYYSTVCLGDKLFMQKFIWPYKEVMPHLAQDYADACRGQVPTTFKQVL